MLPVRMIEIYWSAVQMFRNRPEATVEATSPTVRFAKRINTEVMLPNIPLAVMAPPKHIAQIISQIGIHHTAHTPCVDPGHSNPVPPSGPGYCHIESHDQPFELRLHILNRQAGYFL